MLLLWYVYIFTIMFISELGITENVVRLVPARWQKVQVYWHVLGHFTIVSLVLCQFASVKSLFASEFYSWFTDIGYDKAKESTKCFAWYSAKSD